MEISKEGLFINNIINPMKSLAYKIHNAKEKSKIKEVVDKIEFLISGRHKEHVKLYKDEGYIEALMLIGSLEYNPHSLVYASIKIDKYGDEFAHIKAYKDYIDVYFLEIEGLDSDAISICDEMDKIKYRISLDKEHIGIANEFIVDACNEIDSLMPDLSNEDIDGFKALLDEFISIRDIMNKNPNEVIKPEFYQNLFESLYRSRYKTLNITYDITEREVSIRIRDRHSLVDMPNYSVLKLKYNQSTGKVEVVSYNETRSAVVTSVDSIIPNSQRNGKLLAIVFNRIDANKHQYKSITNIYMDMNIYENLKAQIYGLKEFISETINKSLEQTSITTNNDSTMPEQDNNKSGMTRIENPFNKYFLKTAGITNKESESDEYNKYAERVKGDLAMIKSSIRQIVKSVNNYFLNVEFTNIEIVDPKNLFCMTFLEDDREMIMLLNLSALNIYASYSINNIEIKVSGKGVVDAVDVKEDNPTVNIIKGNIFINDKIVSESPEVILSFSDALEVLDYIENNIESMLEIAENRRRLSRKIITL